MLNRKLLNILRFFDALTYKKCHKFLLSPYFNDAYNADKIIELYEYIRKYQAVAEHPKMQKPFVFSIIYPNEVYTEGVSLALDVLMSDLLKLVKQFLAHEHRNKTQDKEFEESLAQSVFFGTHGEKNAFAQTIERAQKHLSKQMIHDSAYFQRKYVLERTIHDFESIFNDARNDTNLLNTHKYLDTFYATLKMELASALLLKAKTVKMETENANILTNALLPMIETGVLEARILHIYLNIINMISSPHYTLNDIEDLEQKLTVHEKNIPKNKFIEMQACVRIFRTNLYYQNPNESGLQQIWLMYQAHLTKGYMYRDNKLLPMTLITLVNVGLKLQEFDWVKMVLDTHKAHRIWHLEQSEEFHKLNQANLYFHLKDYEKAENLLKESDGINLIRFKNTYHDTLSGILIAKIYYEQSSPLLDDRINAFRVRIARSPMPNEQRQPFYNFLNKLAKLAALQNTYGKELKQALLNEIKSEKMMAEKEWLMTKVIDLI